MNLKAIGLASLGAVLATSTIAHAAVGLTQTVYYNTTAQGAPAYSFVNSNDAFQYSSDDSISSFFGADAAGAATTDATPVDGVSFTASGFVDVLTAGTYTFKFYADDYASLTLDGSQIADGHWYSGWRTVDETLGVGYHPIALTYVANGTPNGLSYSLTGPGFEYVTTSLPAVPEPSTWALAVVGLGLAGATLRRRQRREFGAAAA